MTSHDSFWRELQPAAVFKHKLFTDYLTLWCPKVGSLNGGKVAFLDGYAGAGSYENGAPGSPLIAMDTARKVKAFPKSVDLKCIFVEKNPETADKLEQTIRVHGDGLNVVQPFRGDLKDHLPAILKEVGDRPLLAFLDPFGTSLPADVLINQLIKRPNGGSTEVLLNFSIEAVWRLGGLLTSNAKSPKQSLQTGIDRADQFLGGSWWHEEFIEARKAAQSEQGYGDAARAAAHIASRFAEHVCARTGYQALAVPVRKVQGREPFFSLMLFHTSDAAKLPFLDSAARAHRVWRAQYWENYADQTNDENTLFQIDFTPDREADEASTRDNTRMEIRRNLLRLLASHPRINLPRSAQLIYGSAIGTAGTSELRAVLKQLHKEGRIDPPPSGRSIERGTIQRRS